MAERNRWALWTWVALVLALASTCLVLSAQAAAPFPGWDAVLSMTIAAVVLEQAANRLRVNAYGSISFVIYFSAALLFGGFWAGAVTACASFVSNLAHHRPPLKLTFNVAQRVASIVIAVWVYEGLGGHVPPSFVVGLAAETSALASQDLVAFIGLVATYVCVNSTAVSVAVALSSGRPVREVWTLNFKGVLLYDFGASVVALATVALFHFSQVTLGSGVWGLALAILPIVAIRHVYTLYHQLQDSGQELLELMVKAIEARDPYTSGHSLRVRNMSRAIAIELGLAVKKIEEVETAALLHDVGKIHEEFAPLLRKEAPLTTEEMALMQTHAVKSADLVGVISRFRGSIQSAVRHHHERWDGEGYPDGISGSDIPLISRIILIADTIDAMTTDRPYRSRLPVEAVIAELQRCSGTQFDPRLVEVAIGSVAVRRLIAGHGSDESVSSGPQRSRRVSLPSFAAKLPGAGSAGG